MNPPYVTTGKAAAALGISTATLRRWADAGLVTPALRSPRRGDMRWDLADLERQLDARRPTTQGGIVTDPAAPVRPPIVAAIVTSNQGVLITRRHDGKPLWGFVTGEVEQGESPLDAAIREVKEEAELEIVVGHMIGERNPHPQTGRHVIYLAARPYHGTAVAVGDSDELAEVAWVNLPTALERMPTMYEPVREHLAATLG